MWVIAIFILALLGSAFASGLFYFRLIEDLPSVGNIETMFAGGEKGFLEPIHIYDRSHAWMFDLLHPNTADRRWMSVEQAGEDGLPKALLDAMVIAHDKTFWTNQGYDSDLLLNAIIRGHGIKDEAPLSRSISQRLVQMTILPSEDFLKPDLWRYIREALLAQRLSQRYPKKQILEWYLNSVEFGSMAYGADAGALLYFDKHANQLTLAECVMLAAVSMEPMENPSEIPERIREHEAEILQAMLNQGWITASQSRKAQLESIKLHDRLHSRDLDLQLFTMNRVVQILGENIADRTGLYVFTTIDSALQAQVECEIQTLVFQLNVQNSDSLDHVPGIESCSASGQLSNLTPGEVGGHSINELAGMILDTRNGEILSLYGPVDRPVPSTSILYPWIYLTAFSRGNSPGTMVLDLPLDDMHDERLEGTTSHGPILMREALAGGYAFAAKRMVQMIGLENVLQVIGQMGVSEFSLGDGVSLEEGFPESYPISLIDAAYSYGILANMGKMVGAPAIPYSREAGRSLDPIFISDIMDQTGRSLYSAEHGEQSIVSQELSFLITDTLKDSTARTALTDRSDIPQFVEPSTLMVGNDQTGDLSWAVGYTPSRAVGVWTQDQSKEGMIASGASWTSAIFWHALMNLGMQDIPLEDWQVPPGIHQVEICEPSGMLPTQYCRSVIKDYFIGGTEPIQYDTLFVPFQINIETGKLATLFTPIDLVEEEVFFVPPSEAKEWASEAGFLQPPEEYDTLNIPPAGESNIGIEVPQNFDYIRNKQWISGRTQVDGFNTFFLQYGEGLNPTQWFRMGEIQSTPVVEGTLALWDTSQLDGLYALQLIVVDQDSIAHIDTKYVIVDNESPEVAIICPDAPLVVRHDTGQVFSCNVRAEDNFSISKIEFWINERKLGVDLIPPYEIQMEADTLQEGLLFARAYDLAGNFSQSEPVPISIEE